MIFSDKNLSQKLELADAKSAVAFVEARARLSPETNSEWIEVGGTHAMFDGIDSPLTQTFGLGVLGEVTDKEFDKLEAFFKERNAPVFHEVSPMADPSLLNLLNERNYQPCELSSVLYQELENENFNHLTVNSEIQTRLIENNEGEIWAKTSAKGWATIAKELEEFMLNFGKMSVECEGSYPFLANINAKPISAGMLFIHKDVAILGGASTIPEDRRQGGQLALLKSRLEFAQSKGCKIAIMGAAPGSQSQKNAEKNDFRIAYTRTKWQLKTG